MGRSPLLCEKTSSPELGGSRARKCILSDEQSRSLKSDSISAFPLTYKDTIDKNERLNFEWFLQL